MILRVFSTAPEPVRGPESDGVFAPFAHRWASFFPDGHRLAVLGTASGGSRRLYLHDLPSGLPRLLLTEARWSGTFAPETSSTVAWSGTFTPDGRSIVGRPLTGDRAQVFPLEGGGEPQPIRGLGPGEDVVTFTTDGRAAFVREVCAVLHPCKVVRPELETGSRTPWLKMLPPGLTGFVRVGSVAVHPSGRFYAYNYLRMVSSLYLIEGLK